jgi:hypothetical protein
VNDLYVLVAVDTAGALASGSLVGNCYAVDTNHYIGSWREGSDQLSTVCQDGQRIVWSPAAVAADAALTISGFGGPMVDQGICRPSPSPEIADGAWSGQVEAQGQFAPFDYTVTLTASGSPGMQANCLIKVV